MALGVRRAVPSHFPVAGSVYQWSKRLSNRGLGWFTGWFYFWAQVVTVMRRRRDRRASSSAAWPAAGSDFLDSPSARAVSGTMHAFIAVTALLLTTVINAYGVRLLSVLNNIGVATEILGHASCSR